VVSGFSITSRGFPSQSPAPRERPHTQIEQYSLHTIEAVHLSRTQTEPLRSHSVPPPEHTLSTSFASQHELKISDSDHDITYETTTTNPSRAPRADSPVEEVRFSTKPVNRESREWVMVRKAPVILPRAISGVIVPSPRNDELWLDSGPSSEADVSPPSSAIQPTGLPHAAYLMSPLQPERKISNKEAIDVDFDRAPFVSKLPPFQPLSLSLSLGPTLYEEIFGTSTKRESGVRERKGDVEEEHKKSMDWIEFQPVDDL
jgi:hypothetical protein